MPGLNKILDLEKGVTSFIGGGGKTTAIFNLAKELSSQGKRVIVTTTTKMFVPDSSQVDGLLIDPSILEIGQALKNHNCIGVAGAIKDGKIHCLDDLKISMMKDLADYVLVEADGSKRLPIKVPGENEPAIPSSTDRLVIVVGLRALGRPISKSCFRSEKAMEILGVDENHPLSIENILKLIKSPNGLSKGIGGYNTTLILNQSDTLTKEQLTKVKKCFGEDTTNSVILASIQKGVYHKL